MERMPDHVMTDLTKKVIRDVSDVILRNTALVPHPLDKFQITAAAAHISMMCLIGGTQCTYPQLQGERARAYVMQEINKLLSADDNFITETVTRTRSEES